MEKLDCGISNILRSVPKYELGYKSDTSVSLYSDKDSEAPECTHRMTVSSRHNLFKLIALIGAVTVGAVIIGAICSCIKFCCKRN